MMRAILAHPLHLVGILGGAIVLAVGISMGLDGFPTIAGLGVAFMSAVDLARRLGLEPEDDPAAPHNKHKRMPHDA